MVNPIHKGTLSHPNPPTIPTPTREPNLCFEVFESFRLTTDVILPKIFFPHGRRMFAQKNGLFEKKMPLCDFCLKNGCKYAHRFDGVKYMFIAEVKGVLKVK